MASTVPKEVIAGIPEHAPRGDKKIQLYSLATPNGKKVGIMLEELGLSYDAHLIDISKNVQFEEWFKAINPNSKIPALIDLDGPEGKPVTIFESAAILIYLADKTGKFLAPNGTAQRYATLAWTMLQMGGVGPIFGQVNHFFAYAPEDVPYAKKRYLTEALRLLDVLELQLSKYRYLSGSEYTVADIATFPWVQSFLTMHAEKIPKEKEYSHIKKWVNTILERPAVQRGLKVTSK